MTEEELIAQETAFKKKKPEKKKVKQEKSESDLVHEYVNRVIRGKQSRGHVDKRFAYTKTEGMVNKELWLDTDFFFSVVFQSQEQKYEFLKFLTKKFQVDVEGYEEAQVQIVNGMRLAERMGCKLHQENIRDFPYGSLDLRPFILDDEEV